MTVHFTATNVHKSFHHGQSVLAGISLTARPGSLTVIRGRPGSGRSTLLRCLTGGYRIDAGVVELAAAHGIRQLTELDPRSLSWLRQHYLAIFDGAVPTAPSQTCAAMVQRLTGQTPEAIGVAFERLDIAAFTDVPIGRLRPTQRDTVALAAALLDAAPVVILDEPEAAARDDIVCDWIHQLVNDGKTVIATTAESSMLADSARHTATLIKGTLQWD